MSPRADEPSTGVSGSGAGAPGFIVLDTNAQVLIYSLLVCRLSAFGAGIFQSPELSSGMTKADIARIVYERHGGISNREAARLVEVIFETIKRHLGQGEKVQITGFGTFLVRQKRERRGRNPQTGEEMLIRH